MGDLARNVMAPPLGNAAVTFERTGPAVCCRIEDRQVSITFGPMTTPAHLIDLLFVIAPHSLLLDIAGPAEAFRLANLHRAARKMAPRFRLRFTGPLAKAPSSVGLALADLEPLPALPEAPTWVVLAGQPSAHVSKVTPAVAATAHWLSRTL